MPASRTFSTKSIRSDDQHPYIRHQEPLNRYTGYEPEKILYKDPRKKTSPRVVNSHSLLDPTGSEKQTWSKMGTTLIMEVQSSRLTNVPKLAEDLLTDKAISNGIAQAKGDKYFAIAFSDIITTIRNVPLRIGKLIAVNFWRERREDAVVPETAGVPISTDTDSNTQAVKVDETTTKSSDQDSQATMLDENASLASGSNGDGTKVNNNSVPSSTANQKKGNKGKGKGKKKTDNKPKKPLSNEEQIAIFLNRVADQIREALGINTENPNKRIFSARFKDKAPDDAPVNCIRKPDCVVLDYNVAFAERACWSDVHSLIEIKKSSAVPVAKDAYIELLNCARMVFAAQHNRRFVLGATMSGADMVLFVFDRSGVVGSRTFDINKEPEFLIRVVCGLIFVDDIRLGLDTTIEKKDEGGYTITMNGIEFDCEEPMYIEKAVRGRGTGCFKTSHDGEDAVIKDSWVDDSRKKLEHEILEKVKDVEGIVRVIDHEVVQVEGKDDSTSVARRRLAENNYWISDKQWKGFNMIEARTHRRILMKPYGQPLESFSSLEELMLAIKDIVKIIEDLIERKVLHRDISLRNLILARADPNDPNSRIRGYLIDFDYALDLENISEDVAKGARTGTLPFMAIEMLVEQTNNKVPHAYYHDLESVFYSLCWLCTSQQGPYDTPRYGFKFSESTCAKWNGIGMDNPTLEDIRDRKAATVYNDSAFTERVLDQFAPYFAPLKAVIAALRQVMINKDSNRGTMAPLYRSQLDKRKEAMARARENGDPVDAFMLSTIPNSERDHRDVFNLIYDIIDAHMPDIKEPVLPKFCVRPPKEPVVKVKKLSREEIDLNLPKGVRELVDGNAEAKAHRAEGVAVAKVREREANGGINPPGDTSFPPCSDAYQKLANLAEASRKFNEQLDATAANNKTIFERQNSQLQGSSSDDWRGLMAGAEIKTFGSTMDKPFGNIGPPSSLLASGSCLTAPAEIEIDGGSMRRKVNNTGPPPSPDRYDPDERSRTPTPADYDFEEHSKTPIYSPPSLGHAIYSDSDRFTMTPTPRSPHCNSVGEMGTPLPLGHAFDNYFRPHTPPRSESSTSLKRARDDESECEVNLNGRIVKGTSTGMSPLKKQKYR